MRRKLVGFFGSASAQQMVAGICRMFAMLGLLAVGLPMPTPPARAASPLPQRTHANPTAFITIYVDRDDDNNVTACTAAANDCTLRGAINKANGDSANLYTIYFSPTVTLVALLNPLPTLTANDLWIWGNAGVPRIDALFMNAGDVFSVNANRTLILGLSVVNGHTSGGWADIYIAGGSQNMVVSNFLGTLPGDNNTVNNCTPNPGGGSAVTRNSQYGIYLGPNATGSSGAGNGSVYVYGNTIGCHSLSGIEAFGTDYLYIGATPEQLPAGNYLGVNAYSVPLTNGVGIYLRANSSDAPRHAQIAYNFIANSQAQGIYLEGNGTADYTGTSNNHIISNTIGLAPNQSLQGNGSDGVLLTNAAFQNFIGGPTPAEANVIAGNGENGVRLQDAVANGVLGNYIGVNAYEVARPNAANGVQVVGGEANIIGGALYVLTPATRGNYIGRNGNDGLQFTNNTLYNYVTGNTIVHNGASGIALLGGANQNIIGGSYYTQANTISLNVGYGVYLADSGTTTNTLQYAGIYNNGNDGVTIQNGASGNQIGGLTAATKNIIGYGQASGIYITNANANQIYYNDVISNTYYGIILDGPGTYGTYISRTTSISNTYDGIGERNGAGFNVWTEVETYGNGGLGVDKDASSDFGNIVNPPTAIIHSVIRASGVITLSGTGLNGSLVELYAVAPDPSGMGEGKLYLGTAEVSGGVWSFVWYGTPYGCFTPLENVLGIASSEFGPNTCRQMLPFVRR